MTESSVPRKVCKDCKQFFDLTPDNFFRCAAKKDGFSLRCKSCDKYLRHLSYERNKEAIYARNQEWRDKNPEAWKAIRTRTRQKNVDKNRAGNRERGRRWEAKHPEQKRAYTAKRRAKLRAAEGVYTDADLKLQFKAQRGKCWWCGDKLKKGYHADHITPLNRGGTNKPENIVLACPHCNCSRQDKLPQEWNGRLF